MGHNPVSVVAPARVKILLIPIGHITQSRFSTFVERLHQEDAVRLGDISPDSRPHRSSQAHSITVPS